MSQIIPASGALVGGSAGSIDSILVAGYTVGELVYYTGIVAGDMVLYVAEGAPVYYKWVVVDAPQTEQSPDIIVPDWQSAGVAYTGNGAWHLCTGDVLFTTTGATFAPTLIVAAGGIVTWTFSDGTTSHLATPNKDFGTAATRVQRLNVTPWSALTRVNIGYDAGDGGDGSIERVTQCDVTNVDNMYLMAPYLEQWCSSNNTNLLSLNFDNFVLLDTIECYRCSGLANVRLHNTPLLARACFENCELTCLDLSESPSLADLRGAQNGFNGIHFGPTGRYTWHICVQTNTHFAQELPAMTQFPVLEELFIWSCNQNGELKTSSTALTSVQAENNHYTSADFTGGMPEGRGGAIDMHGNDLASIVLTGCDGVDDLNLSDNSLSASACHDILHFLDTEGGSNGTVDLSDNAIPDGDSATHITSLEGKGWTVTVDSAALTLESIAVTPASSTIYSSGTQQFTATGTYDDESTADITDDVTWSSSSTGTATIASGGLATGVAGGSTTITATSGEISGNTGFTVTAVALSSIAVTPASSSVNVDSTRQYTATGTYNDSSTADITSSVTWTSSATNYATISSGGLATGVAAGSATITATLGGISGNTGLTVASLTLESIAVTPANPSIYSSGTQQFTATATYDDESTADITDDVTWSSNQTGYVTIASGGLASGVAAGSATITATLGEISGNTGITINAVTLSSIAVTPADEDVVIDATQQFVATGTYNDSTTAVITDDVTWTSGTTAHATIDSDGLATGVAAGDSTITATLGTVSGNTTLTTIVSSTRVDFTTSASEVWLAVATLNDDTAVTWHWSDGTTSSGLAVTKDFGTAASRTHYMTMTTPTNLDIFYGNTGNHDDGAVSISGLDGFTNLSRVYGYTSIGPSSMASLDISGCHNLRQLHIMHTSLDTAAMDTIFNDLIVAVPGSVVGDSPLFYANNSGTSASLTAREDLTTNGWPQSSSTWNDD